MKKFTLLLLAFSGISLFTFGQWTTNVMVNTLVDDNVGTEQATPMIAPGLNGKTFISWFDMFNGMYQLKMQLLDSNGVEVWAPGGIVISNHPQNSALFRYDLASDKEGNAIVAFQDERTGDMQVVAYKIDQNGAFVWGANGIVLTDSLATTGMAPAIGITNSNDVIIAWNAQGTSSKWVSFRRLSGSGTSVWPALHRITSANKKYSRPSMIASGSEDIIMQYVEESGNFPGVTSTLFAQRYDLQGNTVWAAPVQISTKTISFFFFPKIQSDGSDGFYLPFTTSNPMSAMMNDVYVQHVDANGVLWSPVGTEAADSLTQKTSAGGVYANGNFYALIQMMDGNQSQSGVYLQKFDNQGNPLLGNNGISVMPVSSDYYLPYSVNAVSDGLIMVYKQGGFANESLYAVKTDFNGLPTWLSPVPMCTNTANKDDLYSLNISNFQIVSVWMDERNDQGIYAQNMDLYGNPGIPTAAGIMHQSDVVKLYPNPGACNFLEISAAQSGNISLQLLDPAGRKLMQKETFINSGQNTISLETESLNPGVYFLHAQLNKTFITRKLILQ